jgi:TRAP-type C4-dicarboxylate transport system permease small subunit
VTTDDCLATTVFAAPLAWTEELATMLFAWLVFRGASLALEKHEQLAIELFVDLLPAELQRRVHHSQRICLVLFCLLLTC